LRCCLQLVVALPAAVMTASGDTSAAGPDADANLIRLV
jgi:hypothetical protein